MMDLNEPKRKKRVHIQSQLSLPLITGNNGEWRVYTAHLSASGTCIVDPIEMEAVYSMGFFGKGSLSRSFPSFGRRRFGAPPIIRDRQWNRRKRWLEELEKLNQDSNPEGNENLEIALESDKNRVSLIETGTEKIFSGKANKFGSETQTELEKKLTEKMENFFVEKLRAEESCNKETLEIASKARADDELSGVKKTNDNFSTEQMAAVACDKKSQESFPKSPVKVTGINPNSSVEFIGRESCVKRARMEYCKKNDNKENLNENNERKGKEVKNHDDFHGNNDKDGDNLDENEKIDNNVNNLKKTDKISSIECEETTNDDEVLLDSTEDEEICEIVNEEPNETNELSPMCDQFLTNRCYSHNNDGNNKEEVNPYELLVLPDTDSDTEDYLRNVKSRIENEGFPVNETLHLTFEETFFLMYGLGCLQLVHYDGSIFSVSDAWIHFQEQDKYFIQKYVVYHYFRSKGWIVKTGLKYGGDFLLYKQGPPFYHASYIVVIEVINADNLIRDDVKSMRKITWKNLIGMGRLSETIAKEILFAQILWPTSILRNGNGLPVEALLEFTVRELVLRRWNPKRKRDVVSVDEEDSDST